MRNRLIRLSTLLWISSAVTGCVSSKESVLPHDGPSMKAIYDAHIDAIEAGDPLIVRRALGARPIASDASDLAGYSRTAHTELDTVFPRLPNPTLVMYVFPHLAGTERLPVPGYATTFPLYQRVEYALPGEVQTGQR